MTRVAENVYINLLSLLWALSAGFSILVLVFLGFLKIKSALKLVKYRHHTTVADSYCFNMLS